MKDWKFEVSGDQRDFERLHAIQTDRFELEQTDGSWWLSSPTIRSCDDYSAAQGEATQLLGQLDAAAFLADAEAGPMRLGHARVQEDAQTVGLFLHDRVGVRVRSSVSIEKIYEDGRREVVNFDPDLAPIIARALAKPEVAQAMRFLREHSWVSLAKVLETVEQNVGGERALQALGWVPAADLRRLTHTANNIHAAGDGSRHARSDWEPPRDPMSIDEAGELCRGLIRAWLDA